MKRLMPLDSRSRGLVGKRAARPEPGRYLQGTLQAGKELRIVFRVSTTDADNLKAVMYSIDQSPQGISGAVAIQAPL